MEKITLENMDQVASQKTCNCPDCGRNELKTILIGRGEGSGIYQPTKDWGFKAVTYFSGIKAIMCTNCRLIIKQFADKT